MKEVTQVFDSPEVDVMAGDEFISITDDLVDRMREVRADPPCQCIKI
jgi:hypothetical protein